MLKMTKTWTALCISSAFALAACNGDDTGETDPTATSTMTMTMPTTMTSSGSTSIDPSSTSTGDPSSTSTGDPSSTSTTTTTDSTTVAETDTTGGDPFVFDETPAEDLTKVDRMGMPAINTAVITSKDDYNAASPVDDVDPNSPFVPEIVANIDGFHMALDDDLIGAGLTPCVTMACVGAAAPLVIPDTIKINLTGDAGFPNGRLLADPVMDVTLALVLLDLNVHEVTTLAGLPLNPPENDKAFLGDFPYLAEPH